MTTHDSQPTIKAVLFDRDDTLSLTNRDVYRQAAAWVARRYGLDPKVAANAMIAQWTETANAWQHLRTLEDEARFWRDYAEKLAARLGVPTEHAEDLLSEWPYERFMTPVPNVRGVLSELRARGLKIGVLSNTLPNVDVTLKAIGVDDLVDVAIASCTLGVHKPDPYAFLVSADRLGVRPSEVLFVDDKLENVEAARGVGMTALLIDHARSEPEAIHALEAVLDAV